MVIIVCRPNLSRLTYGTALRENERIRLQYAESEGGRVEGIFLL